MPDPVDGDHALLLRIALPVCHAYGLALAGGYAIKAHGLVDRPSDDLDLATATTTPVQKIVAALAAAYRAAGLHAKILDAHGRKGHLTVSLPAGATYRGGRTQGAAQPAAGDHGGHKHGPSSSTRTWQRTPCNVPGAIQPDVHLGVGGRPYHSRILTLASAATSSSPAEREQPVCWQDEHEPACSVLPTALHEIVQPQLGRSIRQKWKPPQGGHAARCSTSMNRLAGGTVHDLMTSWMVYRERARRRTALPKPSGDNPARDARRSCSRAWRNW